MKRIHSFAGLLLALLTAAAPGLAQSQPEFALRMRTGATAGSPSKDLSSHSLVGLGIQGSLPVGPGKVTAELGFDYFPGRGRDATQAGPVYINPGAPTTTYLGQPLFLRPQESADQRKESLQGFGLRVGYEAAFPLLEGWDWHAGVSLDRLKTTSEFSGYAVPMYVSNPGTGAVSQALDASGRRAYEGWAISRQTTKFHPGAFAGVGTAINPNVRLDFTLRSFGYQHQDYAPFTYTGRPAELSERSRRGLALEIGLALKI